MSAAHEVFLSFIRSAVIAALLLGSAPAFAQEDEPESERSEGVEDIYVTAERRESRLQETPIAVSVFTGADLDQKGYLDFEDIGFSVPNVQYGRSLVGSGGFTIRGISSSVGDRSTAFHFDGIYADRGSAVEGLTFFDIQRVEVLRGPQGTLYGRNATGGAINVISTPPGPDFEAFGDVQFGGYNQVLWRAALNLPIHSERLFARVSLFGDQRDGYQKNITQKQTITWDGSPVKKEDTDDSSVFGIRNQLRWLPTDNLDLTLRYNYAQRGGVGAAQKTLGDYPDFVTFPTPFGVDLDVDQYCQSQGAMDSGCIVTDNPADNRKTVLDLIGDVDAWSHAVNGQVVWDLPGETQFTGLFSHYWSRSYGLSDQDGSDADLVRAFTTVDTSYELFFDEVLGEDVLDVVSGCDAAAYSAGETAEEAGCRRGHNELAETVLEAQWSSAGGGDLDWVLGAFFLNTKSFSNNVVTTKPAPWINTPIAGVPLENRFNDLQVPVLTTLSLRARSLAAFGQAELDLHDALGRLFSLESDTIWQNWTATFGLRYSYDWKEAIRNTPKIEPILALPVIGDLPVPIQAQIVARDSDRWNSVTGTARLKWDWSDENHLYFSGARGYKSGVIVTALKNATDPDSSFDNAGPERIWAFEVGSKNRFWDNRIQANLTGFYYWYQDLQISQLAEASVITQNAADADVWSSK
ncbi:MAG: TonB-dependent receptor, partial [Myxococcota bacterium]